MDSLTLYWVIAWAVFIACPLYVGTVAVRYGRRWLGNRRKDREWAADLAAKLRARARAVDGEPLEEWEQIEIDRIDLLYGDTAPGHAQDPRRLS
jgi:hypothetical protein